jgi:hypothetical protein
MERTLERLPAEIGGHRETEQTLRESEECYPTVVEAPLVGEALQRFGVEDSLRDSEQRFRSMFEHHHHGMRLIDSESGRWPMPIRRQPPSTAMPGSACGK